MHEKRGYVNPMHTEFLPADHPYPPVGDGRYGTRPILFPDTGERAMIVTIDGEPVAMEPSREALEEYAHGFSLELVTREFMRDVLADARCWRTLPRWARRLTRNAR